MISSLIGGDFFFFTITPRSLIFTVNKFNSKYLKGSLAINSENYLRLFPSVEASKANLDGCLNNYADILVAVLNGVITFSAIQ